jgi:hypothetical protein
MNTRTDLKNYINEFSKYEEDEIPDKLFDFLLQVKIEKKEKGHCKILSDDSTKENLIESMTVRIISLPEYQLVSIGYWYEYGMGIEYWVLINK